MKKYIKPNIEVEIIELEDIILNSNLTENDSPGVVDDGTGVGIGG